MFTLQPLLRQFLGICTAASFVGAGGDAGGYGYRRRERRELRCECGGKFGVLERFLHRIRTETTDKIVLIRSYTQTLQLFERLCRDKGRYGFLRLDGTMSVTKHQKLVDQFNNPECKEFIFLLSSKAGGCGINLIGANRLILFDPGKRVFSVFTDYWAWQTGTPRPTSRR